MHRLVNQFPAQGWICLFIRSPRAVSRAHWEQGPGRRPRAADGGLIGAADPPARISRCFPTGDVFRDCSWQKCHTLKSPRSTDHPGNKYWNVYLNEDTGSATRKIEIKLNHKRTLEFLAAMDTTVQFPKP